MHDLAVLWKACWRGEILPQALVEIYPQPHVHAKMEGEHTSYGHGLWMTIGGGPNL